MSFALNIKLNPEDIIDNAHMAEGIVQYLRFSGIHDIQRYHGGLRRFAPNEFLTLNSGFRSILSCTTAILPEKSYKDPDDSTNINEGKIWLGKFKDEKGSVKDYKVFSKIIHLVNPFEFMKRSKILSYMPAPDAHDRDKLRKHAISRYNQASVDATICYILSRLGDMGLSPATTKYFDTVCGVADNYYYRITDDFLTLRKKYWFWSFADSESSLRVMGCTDEDIRKWVHTKPQQMFEEEDDEDEEEEEEEEEDKEEIHLSKLQSEEEDVAIEELDLSDEIGILNLDEEPIQMVKPSDGSSVIPDDESEDILETLEELGGEILLKCKEIPVLVCFQEAAEGTMDQLLSEIEMQEDDDSDSPMGIFGLKECERMWSAWLFQVCAALSVFQKYVGFVHNDLHTNNIVWVNTTEPYLYYKSQTGILFKVPTYGKIFKLIDFGRATCEIGELQIISSDYEEDEDAFGQYNWGPFKDESRTEIPPNPSFDLSRLAVSLMETLYPAYNHDDDKDENPLAELLWSWLQDDEGKSIMYDADDEERFPGFDLYIHIAHNVHGAVPAEQFNKRAFTQFKWRGKAARSSTSEKVWPIFMNKIVDDDF